MEWWRPPWVSDVSGKRLLSAASRSGFSLGRLRRSAWTGAAKHRTPRSNDRRRSFRCRVHWQRHGRKWNGRTSCRWLWGSSILGGPGLCRGSSGLPFGSIGSFIARRLSLWRSAGGLGRSLCHLGMFGFVARFQRLLQCGFFLFPMKMKDRSDEEDDKEDIDEQHDDHFDERECSRSGGVTAANLWEGSHDFRKSSTADRRILQVEPIFLPFRSPASRDWRTSASETPRRAAASAGERSSGAGLCAA